MSADLPQVTNDDSCFICGRGNPTGLQTRPLLDRQARRATLELAIPSRFQGWQGLAHGGILAALLDEVSVYACMGVSSQLVTAGIQIRYLKPVPVEQPVQVIGEVEEVRRRKLLVKARLICAGELCAEAETTVVLLKTPPADAATGPADQP